MTSQRWSAHFTEPLTHLPSLPSSRTPIILQTNADAAEQTFTKQKLRSLLVALDGSQSRQDYADAVSVLTELEHDSFAAVQTVDEEAETLERAVMTKLIVSLYSDSLDTYLTQSLQIEEEAEWWASIERSASNVAWYLLQTFPERLLRLVSTILSTLRTQNIPITPSQFTPASLRRLFPATSSLKPSILITSMFPHLRRESSIFSSASPSLLWFSMDKTPSSVTPRRLTILETISNCVRAVLMSLTLPIQLSRHECRRKRQDLELIRDKRAEILGLLSQKRGVLGLALERERVDRRKRMFYNHLRPFAKSLNEIVGGELGATLPSSPGPLDAPSLLTTIQELTLESLPACNERHAAEFSTLQRPSRLTRIWPRLVFAPPLTLYAIRWLYVSRWSLHDLAVETKETVEAFFVGWLLEPLKDVVNTVRAKGAEGVIVQKEGVAADLDSLERMTLSLAKEHLHYSQAQLDVLSQQIRVGDLTPVLKIYEEDIKTPVKSALTGTLLRSLFIQIQKAKVDLDQALTGIDRLLKSQELTFAFVGVAPAFAIVYVVGGYVKRLWVGTRGRGDFGGKSRRANTMYVMRRVERLLVSDAGHQDISPLTAGLLLLSVAHLRAYGETYLPNRSRLREGFLQDVEDLENPELGRREKWMVVERMWRSWGDVLGWSKVATAGTFH